MDMKRGIAGTPFLKLHSGPPRPLRVAKILFGLGGGDRVDLLEVVQPDGRDVRIRPLR